MKIDDLEKLKKQTIIGVVCLFMFIMIYKIYSTINEFNQNKNRQKTLIFKQTDYIYNSKIEFISKTFLNRLQNIISGQHIKDCIKNRDREALYKFSIDRFMTLKKDFSSLKQMHYHLPNHTSFLRIHKPKIFGDNLKEKRPLIAETIKSKSMQKGFESGIYDKKSITYRIAIPIMEDEKLLSVVELGIDIKGILAQINSFLNASYNKEIYIGSLLLKDTKFLKNKKDRIDFSNYKLISSHLIIKEILRKINPAKNKQNIELNGRDYFIFWNQEKLENFKNQEVGTFIYAFDITDIKNNFRLKMLFAIIHPLGMMFLFLFILLIVFRYIKKQIKLNTIKIKKIVNNQKSIVIITDGKKIIQANSSFCKFLKCKSLAMFLSKYDCISDKFENIEGYLQKDNDGQNWLEFMRTHKNINHIVKIIDNENNTHIFSVNLDNFKQEKGMEFVVSFEDITQAKVLYKKNKELNELNELNENLEKNLMEKDKQLLQQSRFAQMGEMLSMIAHQWRQPLNAISATSISVNLKSKLGKLKPEDLVNYMENISNYSQHLSQTINDFRDFFKSNKDIKEVSFCQLIESVLGIIEISIETKGIKLIKELESKEKFNTYPNEIKQVILNLVKNAEDILLEKNIKNPFIKIKTYKIEDNHILEVGDNGGGVPEKIIDHIFDPYFSTKGDKDGTGLGLYMSKTIIEKHCGGKLSVFNDNNGAVFRIKLFNIREN